MSGNNKRVGNNAQLNSILAAHAGKTREQIFAGLSEEDRRAAAEVKKIVENDPGNFVYKTDDPFGFPFLLEVEKKLNEGIAMLPDKEAERLFVKGELELALEKIKNLVPDIDNVNSNTDEKTIVLAKTVKYRLLPLLVSRYESIATSEEMEAFFNKFNSSRNLFNVATGQKINTSKGATVEFLNGGGPGNGRGRAGSKGAKPKVPVDPRLAQAMFVAETMTAATEAKGRYNAATIAANAERKKAKMRAKSRLRQVRVQSFLSDLFTAGIALKAIIRLLLGIAAIWFMSIWLGDTAYDGGIDTIHTIDNGLHRLMNAIQHGSTAGYYPSADATLTAQRPLRNAFNVRNETIVLSTDDYSLITAEQDLGLYRDMLRMLQTKKSALGLEQSQVVEQILLLPIFSGLEARLGTIASAKAKLTPSSLGGFGVNAFGYSMRVSKSANDLQIEAYAAQEAAINELIALRNAHDFLGFLEKAIDLDILPEIQTLAIGFETELLQQTLDNFRDSLTPELEDKILRALLQKARSGETRLEEYYSELYKNAPVTSTLVIQNAPPAPTATATAAPTAAPLAIKNKNRSGENTSVVAVTTQGNVQPSNAGRNVITVRAPNLSGMVGNTAANASVTNVSTGPTAAARLTAPQALIIQFGKGELSGPFLEKVLTRLAKRIFKIQQTLQGDQVRQFSADADFYYASVMDMVEEIVRACRANPKGLCATITPGQIQEVKDSLRYLITRGAANIPPSSEVLIPILYEIFQNPGKYPRSTIGEDEREETYTQYKNQKRLDIRLGLAFMSGSLALLVYQGAKRAVDVPLNAFDFIHLLSQIPPAVALRILEWIRGKKSDSVSKNIANAVESELESEEENAAAAPVRGPPAPLSLPLGYPGYPPLAYPGFVPPVYAPPFPYGYPDPMGAMVPRGRSGSSGRTARNGSSARTGRPKSVKRPAILNASAAAAANLARRQAEAAAAANLARRQAAAANLARRQAAEAAAPLALPAVVNAPQNYERDEAARLLLGLAERRGGRRVRRAKTSKKRHMKKRKGTRRH